MAKSVLITGGAKRLGKSMSLYFASCGYDVIIHVNNSITEGEKLISELRLLYPNQQFNLFCFDLTNWQGLESIIKQLFTTYSCPDVIIHNASSYLKANLENVTNSQMEDMMAIHLYAPMVIGQVYKQMASSGQVISILDSAITTNTSAHGMYLLAKKALSEYSKMSALEWAPHFRVNAIALGPVLPPEGEEQGYFESVVEGSPLKRSIEESSLHTSLRYLIDNANVTGQTLFCDSGQHLT